MATSRNNALPFIGTQDQYINQIKSPQISLAVLTEILDDAETAILNKQDTKKCLDALYHIQDDFITFPSYVLEYIDGVLELRSKISELQSKQGQEHYNLPGVEATAYCKTYQYYQQLLNALDFMLQDFVDEYSYCIPVNQAYKALLTFIESCENDASKKQAVGLLNIVKKIPSVKQGAMTQEEWNIEYREYLGDFVANDPDLNWVFQYVAKKVEGLTYDIMPGKRSNSEKLKINNISTESGLSCSFLMAVLVVNQFTCAAAASNVNLNLKINEQNYLNARSEIKHQVEDYVSNQFQLSIMDQLTIYMGLRSQDLGGHNQIADDPLLEPKDLKKYVQLKVAAASQRVTASITHTTQDDLKFLLKRLTPKNIVTHFNLINEIDPQHCPVKSLQELGFADKPSQIFDHYILNNTNRLSDVNYFFVADAASKKFDNDLLDNELISLLHNHLANKPLDSKQILEDLAQHHDKVLFQIAYEYANGHGVLARDHILSLRWADLAMQRGNLWAAVHISEYLSQGSQIVKNKDPHILHILGITEEMLEDMNHVELVIRTTNLKYLRFAAMHGHAYASYKLSEIYSSKSYGYGNAKLAQAYTLQSLVQFPYSLKIVNSLIGQTTKRLHTMLSEFPQFTWETFDAGLYNKFRSKHYDDMQILKISISTLHRLLDERASIEHQLSHAEPLIAHTPKQMIIEARNMLRQTERLITKMTIELNGKHILWPSIDELELYGVQCRPWSTSSTPGYIEFLVKKTITKETLEDLRFHASKGVPDASIRLGECYANGFEVSKNKQLALYFYKQAKRQDVDKKWQILILDKINGLVAEQIGIFCQTTVDHFLHFKNYPQHISALLDIHEQIIPLGLQHFNYQIAEDFIPAAITKPRKAPKTIIEKLRLDIGNASQVEQPALRKYLCALEDGDYSDISLIAYHYYKIKNLKQSLIWYKLGADHGHLPCMYMAGYLYLTGEVVDRKLNKAIPILTRAAAHGYAPASRLLAILAKNQPIERAYLFQARVQNPQNQLTVETDIPNRNSYKAAILTAGFTQHQRPVPTVAWFPVERHDPLVETLWRDLIVHSTGFQQITKLYSEYRENNNAVFLRVAKWYAKQAKEKNSNSMKYYAYLWSLLGFRSGDIAAAHFMGQLSFEITFISNDFPVNLLGLIVDVYEKPGTIHFRKRVNANLPVKVSDWVQDLGLDALCYAAYHGHAHASELLSYVSTEHENTNNDLEYLGRSRAYLAQSLMQGSRLPYTVYNYITVTAKWMEAYKSVLFDSKSNTHYKYHTEAVMMQSICKMQMLMLDHFESTITLISLQGGYAKDHNKYINFLGQIIFFRKQATEFSQLINFEEAKIHGVQIPLLDRPICVAEPIMRPRKKWEWRDCIPELRDPTLSVESQPRMETYHALQYLQHPIINKLNKSWMTNPADILQLWELCLEYDRPDLANRWLEYAKNMGDRVANRIVALRTNNKANLVLLALHGDAEASHYLARSETHPIYGKLLYNQAVKWSSVQTMREEYKNISTKHADVPKSTSWLYYLSALGTITLGLGGATLNWLLKNKAFEQQEAQRLLDQRTTNIAMQVNALRKIPFVTVEHDVDSDLIKIKLLKTNEVTYRKLHKSYEKITDNDLSFITEVVRKCLQMMITLGLKKSKNLNQMKLNELLKEYPLIIKHQLLSSRIKSNTINCLMTSEQRIALIQQFAQFIGFDEIMNNNEFIIIKCLSNFEMNPLYDYLLDIFFQHVFTEYHSLNEKQHELIKLQADRKLRIEKACHLIKCLDKETETSSLLVLKKDIAAKLTSIIPDNINQLGNSIIAACEELIKLLERADNFAIKISTLDKLDNKKLSQREASILKFAEQIVDARKIINKQAEYYHLHQAHLMIVEKAEKAIIDESISILQIANSADHYAELQGLMDEINEKILFVQHHPVKSSHAGIVVDAAKDLLAMCNELSKLLPQVPMYLEDLNQINELHGSRREKVMQATIQFTTNIKNILQVLKKDSVVQRRLQRIHHEYLDDIHHICLKQRTDKGKEEIDEVDESPRSATTSLRDAKSEKAEIIKARSPADVDISLLDFSMMKCIHPSSVKVVHIKPSQRKKSDMTRWLKTEITERLRVLNTLLTHDDFLLNEKIANAEGAVKERFQLLLAMRNNALHYRFMRLQLMLFLVNYQDHNIPLDQNICNQDVRRFADEFVNVLLHNYFKIDAGDLATCITNCYLDKEINKNTEYLVKQSRLYTAIWPPSNIKDVKLPRSGDLLIMDMKRTCLMIAQIRKVTSEKFQGYELWSAYQDSCRMLIMIIGEINQRLHLLCPKLSDYIHHERKDLIPILAFMRECHLIVRNMDKHREDIPAIYESAVTNRPFVVENYTIEELFALVDKAIYLTDHLYKFEHFCSYYLSVIERDEVIIKNKP